MTYFEGACYNSQLLGVFDARVFLDCSSVKNNEICMLELALFSLHRDQSFIAPYYTRSRIIVLSGHREQWN